MSIPARYILALALCGLLPSLAAATPSPRTLAADSLDGATRAAPSTPAAFNEATPSVEPSRIASGGVPGLSLHEIDTLGPDAIKAVLTVRSMARTGTPPSAIDNDYTRLNLALQSAAASSTIELDGRFDWREAFATAAWALGSDGVAGTGDDWSILPAPGRDNITVTAVGGLGTGQIVGPGDVASVDLEGVFYLSDGAFRGWSFRNLEITGFDLSIGMFCCGPGSTVTDYNDVQVTGNRIVPAADVPGTFPALEGFQNIGIHLAFGRNQLVSGNTIELDGGVAGSGADASSMVGLQSNTSGGSAYDGLVIENNTVRVLGAPAAVPTRVRGLWENSHAHDSDIRVRNNRATSDLPGELATNARFGFRITSHSSNASTVEYRGNLASGMQVGYSWLDVTAPATTARLRFEGNTAVRNGTGLRLPVAGSGPPRVAVHYNRIALNTVAGVDNATAVSDVDAARNWWACNEGPNSTDCDATLGPVASGDWLTLRLVPSALIVAPNTPVTLATDVNRTSGGSEISAGTRFPDGTAIAYATSAGTVVPASAPTAGGAASAIFSAPAPANADVSATLDNETLGARIVVTGGASTLCVPNLFDARCDIAYPTIAAAIDAAQPGFTVLLDELAYAEQVVIDVPGLTLEGQGSALTRIAPTTLAANTTWISDGFPYAAIVLVDGVDGVVVRDLAIDGNPGAATVAGCTPGIVGAYFRSASGRLDDAAVRNLVLAPGLRGCQDQFAVVALTATGNADSVVLDGNLIDNYGKGGVVASGAGVALDAIDNAITGRGPLPLGDAGQNGVQVSFGATGNLVGNTISEHAYLPSDFVATGALVYAASATLDGNTFEDNQVGAYYIDSNGEAHGNGFRASAAATGVPVFWGAVFDDPPTTRLPQLSRHAPVAGSATAAPAGTRITGRFTGNMFVGDGSPGGVGLEADAGFGALNVDFSAIGNEVRDWGTGIVLFDCGSGSGCTGSDFVVAELHCNRVTGNGVGLEADLDLTVRAENNWWGCSAGPGGVAGCNDIDVAAGGVVDAAPWLVMSLLPERDAMLVGQTIAVDVDLRRNSDDVDVSAECTLPDAAIGFDTSLGTIAAGALATNGLASTNYTGTVAGTATITASLDQDERSAAVVVSEFTDALFADGFESEVD